MRKSIYDDLNGWQKVQISRHPDRPYTLDYIEGIFKDFIELHGDRNVADDKAMVGGFAKLDNQPVMVIGHQKAAIPNNARCEILECQILKVIEKLCE